MLKSSIAIFQKEVRQEMRTKYAINTLLAFTGASLLVVLFTLSAQLLNPTPKSGLIWIIILFAAMTGMMRSFVHETEMKTWDLLQLHARPAEVYAGKLFYNFIFLLVLNVVTFFFYLVMMDLQIVSPVYLAVSIVFGAAGLASVTTMVSAMIARADRKGAVFSVLCIPLLVPLILILTRTTGMALIDGDDGSGMNDIAALTGYCGATITAGILLFDFIWDD